MTNLPKPFFRLVCVGAEPGRFEPLRSTPPLLVSLVVVLAMASSSHADPASLSGIYPKLAMFNDENECGIGAVVPWADRLWVITYAPHKPEGSSDKLYEVTPDLRQIVRPESIGGTPANRMIHRESGQLFIGPYAIDAQRRVRVIPYRELFGRLTANARHLADPTRKIMYATMEEGIYEVDVNTLAVTELWADEARQTDRRKAGFPGYHGKGFYSGQGVYVYANNGERGSQAQTDPESPSGALAEWDGKSDRWKLIRRNQFTEVTGPGGIEGPTRPATDPIWSVGWDSKSLLFGVREPDEGWTFYRLPKGSHSYDGAHGWNTEWPRIREIGEADYLMTMHGTLWNFPKSFTSQSSAGIAPRSNYLKVIADFCRWNDRIVFGCDDTAKSEFGNTRKAKGKIAAPQSQSNLWFVEPRQLDHIGPVIGRGSVWDRETVRANTPSDPYLFSGYELRGLSLHSDTSSTITMEVDQDGSGTWTPMRKIEIPVGHTHIAFGEQDRGVWIRLVSSHELKRASAVFSYRDRDRRNTLADPIFAGIAAPGEDFTAGHIRARDQNNRSLAFAAVDATGVAIGSYEMGDEFTLTRVAQPASYADNEKQAAMPTAALSVDDASVIYTDDAKGRWRLPKGELPTEHPLGASRIVREVATERDLLNAHGTFYELPARNAGGVAKIRAIATHNRIVHDFCSYRGLFIVSGVARPAPTDNPHIIRSDDGKVAVWAGVIDDIWKLGKPRGRGGPWFETPVRPHEASDPYLMTGYDKKSLTLSASDPCRITAQVDLNGAGLWVDYQTFAIEQADRKVRFEFPAEFQAYWIRFVSDAAVKATAQLDYR